MFTPLFHTCTEKEIISFVYATKLGKHYIATVQNISGFIDFLDMSNSQLVNTKAELKEKCWLANYGNYKLPAFPCEMVNGKQHRECTNKYDYVNFLDMGYLSKEQLEDII